MKRKLEKHTQKNKYKQNNITHRSWELFWGGGKSYIIEVILYIIDLTVFT